LTAPTDLKSALRKCNAQIEAEKPEITDESEEPPKKRFKSADERKVSAIPQRMPKYYNEDEIFSKPSPLYGSIRFGYPQNFLCIRKSDGVVCDKHYTKADSIMRHGLAHLRKFPLYCRFKYTEKCQQIFSTNALRNQHAVQDHNSKRNEILKLSLCQIDCFEKTSIFELHRFDGKFSGKERGI